MELLTIIEEKEILYNRRKMEKIKVIKDVTYGGRFNGKIIDIDGYEPIEGIKAGFCEETGTRCEFSKIDEIEVIKNA